MRCFGHIRLGSLGLEMVHPEFKVLTKNKESVIDARLTPIYPATEGLSQYVLRKVTTNVFSKIAGSTSTILSFQFLDLAHSPLVARCSRGLLRQIGLYRGNSKLFGDIPRRQGKDVCRIILCCFFG